MSKPAAFKACYADWKLIRTRECVQIIFEVPLTAADSAYQVVGGMPNPGKSIWFGIARLSDEHSQPSQKKSWHETQPAQQAGILASDLPFQKFIGERYFDGKSPLKEEDAATFIRSHCGVNSRKDIQPGTDACKKWMALVSDYRAWFHEPEIIT